MNSRFAWMWLLAPGPIAAVFVAMVVATVPAQAQDTARKTNDVLTSVAGIARNLELADVPSPIDIRADRMEFRYGQGLLRYDGNVNVEHAGATIHAKVLEISFEPEGKRSLKKITASGDVQVVNGDETANGGLAVYDPSAGTIVLSEGARLGSGPNSLSGEQVVVYLNERRAVVLGGGKKDPTPGAVAAPGPRPGSNGRIKAVFMPDSLQKKPGAPK